jgi:hypothetical protein
MGSRIQGSKKHRIPDPDQQHWIQNTVFPVQDLGVDTQVAQHLAATYGDRAFSVGKGGSHSSPSFPDFLFSELGLFLL